MAAVDLTIFYDRSRKGKLLGPILCPEEVEGLSSILALCALRNLGVADTAYNLATAYHETAGTMQPIKEMGGNGYFTRLYDVQGSRPALARANGNTTPGDGARYFGRGLAQITWKNNYLRIGKLIGVDLVSHPELALAMANATFILVDGSINGWFTGRKLSNSIPRTGLATLNNFVEARKVINGKDKAVLVASYALLFQSDLVATGW